MAVDAQIRSEKIWKVYGRLWGGVLRKTQIERSGEKRVLREGSEERGGGFWLEDITNKGDADHRKHNQGKLDLSNQTERSCGVALDFFDNGDWRVPRMS